MTQKERLVELLKKIPNADLFLDYDEFIDVTADILLSDGVIVPPCKVGDTVYNSVYCIVDKDGNKSAFADDVTGFSYDDAGLLVNVRALGGFGYDGVGRTMFLTREEAEQALKEREKGDK